MPKLEALQSLRAIAALLVVLNHAIGIAAGHGFAKEPWGSGANFLGAQGVALFFILSGFIMTYTADQPDVIAPSRLRSLHFAVRRIARVVPLYWFFTLVAALVAACVGLSKALDTTPVHLLQSLFFIPYLNAQTVMLPVLPMGWTLNYEMFFYTLFALILLLPHRHRIFTLVSALVAVVLTGSLFYPILAGGIPHSVGEFLTNPILLLFGMGAILGTLRFRYPELILRIPGVPLVLPLLALNGYLAFSAHRNPLPLYWSGLLWLVDVAIVALCIFGRPLALPQLERLGDASYSLYLAHILPLFACFVIWKQLHFAAPILFIAAAVASSILTSLCAYYWLERPLTRIALRLLAPRPNAAKTLKPIHGSDIATARTIP